MGVLIVVPVLGLLCDMCFGWNSVCPRNNPTHLDPWTRRNDTAAIQILNVINQKHSDFEWHSKIRLNIILVLEGPKVHKQWGLEIRKLESEHHSK